MIVLNFSFEESQLRFNQIQRTKVKIKAEFLDKQ